MEILTLERFYRYKREGAFSFEGHRHTQYEVNIVISGELEVVCGDRVFTLGASNAAIFWAGFFHRNRALSSKGTEFISLHFSSQSNAFFEPSIFMLTDSDMKLVELIDEESGYDFVSEESNITEAGRKLLEGFLSRLEFRREKPARKLSRTASLYQSAVKVMENNIGSKMSVPEISKKCGVCTTLLKKAFSEYAGKGVGEYFNEMKIEKAKAMLISGEHSDRISLLLGFSSPSYFSQCFKRVCGMSPREFVTENSKNPDMSP